MSQQYLFEGWQVQRTTLDTPIGKVSVNPEEPPHGFEALFPEGRVPGYHDVAEIRGYMQVASVTGGAGVDKETGASDSDFERLVKFVVLKKNFEIVSLSPYREASEERTA